MYHISDIHNSTYVYIGQYCKHTVCMVIHQKTKLIATGPYKSNPFKQEANWPKF